MRVMEYMPKQENLVRAAINKDEFLNEVTFYEWPVNVSTRVSHECVPHQNDMGYEVTSIFTQQGNSTPEIVRWSINYKTETNV